MSEQTTHSKAKHDALQHERAVNQRYLDVLGKRIEDPNLRGAAVSRFENAGIVGRSVKPTVTAQSYGPLVGRVALSVEDAVLGTDFYIGPRHIPGEDPRVYSWTASTIAELFYRPETSRDPAAKSLTARRTLIGRNSDVVDLTDDVAPGVDPQAAFGARPETALTVTKVEGAIARPQIHRPVVAEQDGRSKPAPRAGLQAETQRSEAVESSGLRATQAAKPLPVLRAAEAVVDLIERPRTGKLSALLSTLQANQYSLVTAPEDQPLVVQGPPGTGKTIVATHRAAFLAHDQRTDEAGNKRSPLRVLIVGPTREYRRHVEEVFGGLGVGQSAVAVQSIPELLSEVADLDVLTSSDRYRPADVNPALWTLAERSALPFLRSMEGQPVRLRAATVLSHLRSRHSSVKALVTPDVGRWLDEMGGSSVASSSARYRPFLAAIALQFRRPLRSFDHLVVDEAQDVTPLEWIVFKSLLNPNGKASLFGDLNQRRSEASPRTWSQPLQLLGLQSVPAESLSVGFRSTNEILTFAGTLIAGGRHNHQALVDGAPPAVIRVDATAVASAAVAQAKELAVRHPDGIVSILTMTPRPVEVLLRSGGWTRDDGVAWWSEGKRIQVLKPESARGLEFDGVVVVEPADIVAAYSGSGALYTALTRATRSLTVVHAGRLPAQLKKGN